MNESRHSDYHNRIASNLPPERLTRLIALHSIGYRSLTMDPSKLDTLLRTTTVEKWQRLYAPSALADNSAPQRQHLALNAQYFALEQIQDESALVRRLLRRLYEGGPLPWQEHPLLTRSLDFFQVKSPTEAIRRLHTETSDGQLSWVKPLETDVRQRVLCLLGEKKVAYDRGCKRDLRFVLEAQRMRLTRCTDEWLRALPSHDERAA